MFKIVIFDLDGTVTDCEHRKHFIDGKIKNWDAFYAALEADSIKEEIASIWRMLSANSEYKIYVLTGRPKAYKDKTDEWLLRHELYYTDIYMRDDGDFTADDVLKKAWITSIGVSNVAMAFEDRDRVVKMYRDLGITCLQVASGDF